MLTPRLAVTEEVVEDVPLTAEEIAEAQASMSRPAAPPKPALSSSSGNVDDDAADPGEDAQGPASASKPKPVLKIQGRVTRRSDCDSG